MIYDIHNLYNFHNYPHMTADQAPTVEDADLRTGGPGSEAGSIDTSMINLDHIVDYIHVFVLFLHVYITIYIIIYIYTYRYE